MKKQLYLILLAFFCTLSAYAQDEITVTGKITDSSNEPVMGAYIIIKDKPGVGTTTDLDGNYSIKTNSYSVLSFSYIGYVKQDIPVNNRTVIDVVLIENDKNVLSQVVVTAAGPEKKASITGAITTVNLKDLRTPTGNITNALAGNVAGIIAMQTNGEPGSNASEFWIRGISTFGANAKALVLVDGFERPFNEINIEDIESFSVLKDASATAIYGSRGANGVILITTKSGEAGKIDISSKVEYGISKPTRLPEFVNGETYVSLANEARITRNQEPIYTPIEVDIFKKGLDPDLYPNVDWKDVMLKDNSNVFRASVNLKGGGSTARYFVSGSYIDEGGIYKSDESLKDYKTNANLTRWNYRANVDFDITKTTLIKAGFSGFLEKKNTPGLGNNDNIWYSILGQNPVTIPIMYSNGLTPSYGTGNRTNPWVLATKTGFREYWRSKAEANITLEQNLKMITEGLRFVGRVGYDTDNKNDIFRLKWPEQYRTERRRDSNGNLVMHRVSTEALLYQETGSWGERIIVAEAELHYNKVLGTQHRVTGLVKFNQREKVETSHLGGDIKRGIPERYLGVSGRGTYSFKDRYFTEFNFGYTGSENFKRGHQFGFFPAISGAWLVSEEKFVKNNLKWLDMFKIRYSYGEVGNDKIRDTRFAYLSDIGDINGYNFGTYGSPYAFVGMHYSQVASDNLTWEIAIKNNFGIDINTFNNKFSATIDIFKDNRTSIYMRRRHLSSIVGVSGEPWANVGKMQAKGFDGQFNFNQKVSRVDLTVRGNITYSKNEVIEFDEQSTAYPYTMTQGYRHEQAKGLVALGLFKDFDDIRNSPQQHFGEYLPGDIKYKDINGDGVINNEDQVAIGATRVPSLVYGLGASARWNNFDFNIHFQGTGKSSYFINGPTVYPFSNGSWGNILADVAEPGQRWISSAISGTTDTERTDAKYPRLSYYDPKTTDFNDPQFWKDASGTFNNYRASTHWLRNGAYLRFKTLEIGYSIPKQFTTRFLMSGARIFFLGNNIAVWDTLKIWDPELASGEGWKYPPSTSYTLGLTFNF